MRDFFHKIAQKASMAVGSPWSFMIAIVIIITWAATGPIFGFSDTWQLVINLIIFEEGDLSDAGLSVDPKRFSLGVQGSTAYLAVARAEVV